MAAAGVGGIYPQGQVSGCRASLGGGPHPPRAGVSPFLLHTQPWLLPLASRLHTLELACYLFQNYFRAVFAASDLFYTVFLWVFFFLL